MDVIDVERRLISAVARSQNMAPLLAHDIQPHHWLQRRDNDTSPEPTPGEVYAWMLKNLRQFRSVPSLDLLHSRFPNYEISESSDSVGALMQEFLRMVNRRLVGEYSRKMGALADDYSRLLDAESLVFEGARDLAREMPGSKVTKLSDALSMLDLYRERQLTGTTPGISTSMQWLDDLTYGVQRYEMMIIEGFLGTGKSTHGVHMAADGYFLRGQTPMFFSLEMEADALVHRWIAKCAKFKYSALKRLQLGEEDLERWERIGEAAEASRFEKDVLVIDDERHPTSDFIYSKIEQWRPSFVIVDTIDEVRAPSIYRSHWEKQDHIARELKGIARATKVPMVVIVQAGREAAEDGATLGNIAGSITIARKADIALGIHATAAMKEANMREYRLLKNRDDGGEGTVKTMYQNPSDMTIRPWVPSDNVAAKPS